MADLKSYLEEKINSRFLNMEDKLRNSFVLVRKDAEMIKEKVGLLQTFESELKTIKERLNNESIESLKPKLSAKFEEINNKIRGINENFVKKDELGIKIKEVANRIEELKRSSTKDGIKESIYENLSQKLAKKFEEFEKRVVDFNYNIKTEMESYCKRLEGDRKGLAKGFDSEKEKIILESREKENFLIKEFDKEKGQISRQIEEKLEKSREEVEEIKKEFFKKFEEKEKDLTSLRGQIAFLKGRISVFQNQINIPEKKQQATSVEKKEEESLPERSSKRWISQIIDSLSDE